MTLVFALLNLATVWNQKKVYDNLFTDQQLRQIEITEMEVKKVLLPFLVV